MKKYELKPEREVSQKPAMLYQIREDAPQNYHRELTAGTTRKEKKMILPTCHIWATASLPVLPVSGSCRYVRVTSETGLS